MVSNTTFHIFWQSGVSVFGFLLFSWPSLFLLDRAGLSATILPRTVPSNHQLIPASRLLTQRPTRGPRFIVPHCILNSLWNLLWVSGFVSRSSVKVPSRCDLKMRLNIAKAPPKGCLGQKSCQR